MKRKAIILSALIIVLGFSVQSVAQFTPEELAEREKWEQFLIDADVVSEEQMQTRAAVTNPWVIQLEKDGVRKQALWKNAQGRMRGFVENWKWEIAAYRLDKYLGLNMVPPTVEKRFHSDLGSCQLWIHHKMSLKEKYEQKIKTPSYKVFPWNRALYLQRAFDNLIANEDRHQNQYLITEDWRMILIDHSRSFRTTKKFTTRLIYDEKYKEGSRTMKELPRAFVEKLKAMNQEVVQEVVGEYLTDKEIEAVLKRKDLIIIWIENRIKEVGEENVLYD
ncbi:MAG: hypothetical protein JSV46_11435 [Candidatus Aminicenantes bacterium]|nr:MAG: hypothetical protein JSV46_11435 [Candidatus Aminicenantes bacterium]